MISGIEASPVANLPRNQSAMAQGSAPSFARTTPPTSNPGEATAHAPRNLYFIGLDQTLRTTGPRSVAQALEHASRRGKFNDPAFRSYIIDTLAQRTDARAFACIQQAASYLETPPGELLDAARNAGNRSLMCSLGLAHPQAINPDGWRWFEKHAPDFGRGLLQTWPELDAGVPFNECLHLYLPDQAFSKPKTAEERQAQRDIVLLAMARFPHHADEFASRAAPANMPEAWEWALTRSPLPHSETFWGNALQRAPLLVKASIHTRPEAVDRNLIAQAANRVLNDILEAACKVNPAAINEPDPAGWTPAQLVANTPVYAEQFEIMKRYGVDPNLVTPNQW